MDANDDTRSNDGEYPGGAGAGTGDRVRPAPATNGFPAAAVGGAMADAARCASAASTPGAAGDRQSIGADVMGSVPLILDCLP